nr:alpha/beta fold hydrolase [Mycobacterium vicinigordonae]
MFGEPEQPTVLLWHGMQTDARAALRPLANLLAGHGATVVAPDWNSHSVDGGRADLLRSLEFTRAQAGQCAAIVLVGWSLGGVAAAGLTVDARHHDVQIAHTVCLAGAFMAPDPITGRAVTERLSSGPGSSPFTLLHGLADNVVPVSASREFAAALERVGWPVEIAELAADHGSIAGAEYDDVADRYVPGRSARTQRVAAGVAARIATTFDAGGTA